MKLLTIEANGVEEARHGRPERRRDTCGRASKQVPGMPFVTRRDDGGSAR